MATAIDYASKLGRAQKAYQEYKTAGRTDLMQGAAAEGKRLRAEAQTGGVNLSGLGATNKNGTDFTSYYNGKGPAGVYDPAQAGQVVRGPEVKMDATPTVQGDVSSNPSTDLINQIYDSNRAAQLQALLKARDTALQGLNGVETTARQGAYSSRNQADVVNSQEAQRVKELLANDGLNSSGDSITANVQLGAARQGALNDINQSLNNTLTDVGERRSLINSNAAGDEMSMIQQLQAAKANMQLNQFNQDRSYGLDLAGLTGNFNGQKTLAGQQFDYGKQTDQRNFDYQKGIDQRNFDLQKAGQEWNQNFQQGQFNWQKASDLWDRTFKEKNFTQQVQDAAASRGLQWAHLAESQKARIADDLFREKSFGLQQSEFNWSKDPNNPDNKYKSWQSDPNNPDNLPKLSEPSTKQIESTYVSNINKLPPDKLKGFFSTEQSSIINDLGIDGYNRLYGTYFDQYGLPKKR